MGLSTHCDKCIETFSTEPQPQSEESSTLSQCQHAPVHSTEDFSSSPVLNSFLAGSISGTVSTLLLQPFDFLKTRIQTPITEGKSSNGLISTFKTVIKQEGLLGLWKGTTPSIARCVPGVGLYFASLELLQKTVCSDKPSNAELVVLGAGARCISGALLLPFTVTKVRFESGQYKYHGLVHAVRYIHRTEGAKGLYSGMVPTLVRDAPFSGIYLLFYTNAKDLIPADTFSPLQMPAVHFMCGIFAGIVASLLTQPADVVKTFMQIDPVKFANIRAVIAHIYSTRGLRGFGSGFVPRALRRTLMSALSWTLYEQVTGQKFTS